MKQLVNKIKANVSTKGTLAVILVGNNQASEKYVKGKEKDCKEVGIDFKLIRFDDSISQDELINKIDELNSDDSIGGILVQLPLPKHIDEYIIACSIHPDKDVDGFNPINLGKMLYGKDTILPCTPKGVMEILKPIGDLSGKNAVVIGRSNIVGKPMAILLLQRNATVTICHSRTKNLQEHLKKADIVVVAVGKPKFIKGEWLKPNSIVIDVGINVDDSGKLCGDVDYNSAIKVAKYVSPVPCGVGLMTRAMLLKNCEQTFTKNS